MLKNRQEGILNLHGLWETACLLFLFLFTRFLFDNLGYRLRLDNFNLYMAGIVIGSFANVRLLKSYAEHFHNLGWYKTFRLTFQQLIRIMLLQLAVVFALKDAEISRLFLSTYFGAAFLLLFAMNKILPNYLCRLSFKTQVIPTIIVGSTESLSSLDS